MHSTNLDNPEDFDFIDEPDDIQADTEVAPNRATITSTPDVAPNRATATSRQESARSAASIDDPEAGPIWPSSDEEEQECSICVTEHDGIQHVHQEHMCIHCGAFMLGGGNACINPQCPSTLDASYVWVDALERTDPTIQSYPVDD